MRPARAASAILGSGVVVVPALLAGRAGLVVLAVGLLAAATMPLAAALFRWRPVRSVRDLPLAPRLVYSAGFLGGSVYFTASAVALVRAVWDVGAWAAVLVVMAAVTVLGRLLARRPLPAPAIVLRCVLALAVAALLPLTDRPADALGPAGGQLPLPALAVASLLLCVGWESAGQALDRTAWLVAVLSCSAVAGAACWWAGATGLRSALSAGPGWDRPVAAVAAGLLILFAGGNTAALAAFWQGGGSRVGRRPGQLVAAAAVFAGYGVLAGSGADRGWVLLVPGLATLSLYTAFALARRPAGPARTAMALVAQSPSWLGN